MQSCGLRYRLLNFFEVSKALTCAIVLAILLVPIAASAQQTAAVTPLTAFDLEPWLDGFMGNAMRVNEVQGAVVVVIKDSKIISQKGYGYSDAAKRIPVDPENTMFRLASISKLFVWTSIMQLVEQGKIDLDADINTYLDFKIIGMGGKKITVRHLMTHRAGFEDIGKAGFFSDPALLKPLSSVVKGYVPKRIFAPGSTPAYSNYGATLAGYIVQRVSGIPFEAYVERNIFAPLGMAHSTFRQPLPKALQPFMSKGYELAGSEPQPFEMMNDIPAGALSASTSDMVRFMIAHLEAERAIDGKLIKPGTARLMHRSLVRNIPDLNGMALGFDERNMNGRKVIAHSGDLNLFHSDLSLFIDEGIGVYIAMNSTGNNAIDIRNELLYKFSDRYMPITQSRGTIARDLAKAHLEQVKGAYIMTRRIDTNFARLANLFTEFSISGDDKGFLILEGLSKPMRFQEIRPYLWQQVDGKELLSVTMKDGRPMAMSINMISPIIEFKPVAAFASASILMPAFLIALSVLVVSILAWPIGAIARKLYGVTSNRSTDQRLHFLARQAASICLVITASGWIILLVAGLSSGLTDADNSQIMLTQTIALICTLIAAVCIFVVACGLFTAKRSRLQAKGTAMWLAASGYIIWFYYSFNLLKIGSDF
jgi:CubicO group peptidase (beta-lactamase class C family)